MKKTLLDLAAKMDEIAASASEIGNEAKKTFVNTFIGEIVYDNPVDTSKSLSNWQVSDAGVGNEIDALYPGELGSTQRSSANEAISRAQRVTKAVKPGTTLTIFNATKYIRRLNEGYSAQAPAGFIEAAEIRAMKAAGMKK